MKRLTLLLILIGLLLSACTPAGNTTPTTAPTQAETKAPEPTEEPVQTTLTVMTHDSFAVSAELVEAFQKTNNVTINFVKAGDTGSALNRIILTSLSGTPAADVFFGLDNTFLSRALENDLFIPYQAPALKDVPADLQLDADYRVVPIDFGDVCINYDKAYFEEKDIPLPESLVQLKDPVYEGLLAVENPATSSPGLSFMLATIAEFGEDGWLDWWAAMKENSVVIVSDWETAYYTNFSGSSGKGPQPMVVSYASSPAAELIYSDPKLDVSPTAFIIAPNTCWRQVEFAGILRGTKQQALAEKFIDFMLSPEFQADVPMQMFVYPVLSGVALPAEFEEAAQVPQDPAELDPALIAANREAWTKAWSDLMLK